MGNRGKNYKTKDSPHPIKIKRRIFVRKNGFPQQAQQASSMLLHRITTSERQYIYDTP